MLDYIRNLREKKRKEEKELAEQNKRKILDKMEDYYTAIQQGAIYIKPRYLAIQDYWNAKKSGRLDKLNQVKKKPKND